MQNRPTGRKKNITGQAKDTATHGQAAGQRPVGNQGGYQGRDMNRPSGPSGGGQRPSGNRSGGGGGGKLGLIGLVLLLLLGGGGGLSGLFGGGSDTATTTLPVSTQAPAVQQQSGGYNDAWSITATPKRTATPRPTASPTPRPTQAPTQAPAGDDWESMLSGFLGYGSGASSSSSSSSGYSYPADTLNSLGGQNGYTDISSLLSFFGGDGQTASTATPRKTATSKKTATPRTNAQRTAAPIAAQTGSVRAPFTSLRGGGRDTATIMVYMCGADLESKSAMATRDLQEMLAANVGDQVNLIILTGGSTSWRNNLVSNRTHQLWQVKGGKLKCLSQDEGSASMTNPSTLSAFIKKAAANFPADRYALILWDHGSGTVSGYGYDELNARSGSMSLAGINQALTDAGVKFDFVGFDACLMATVETGLMLADHADYMIASEETEPGYGWYYTDWLNLLNSNTSVDTATLGRKIVDDFVTTSARQAAGQKTTLSVTDLMQLDASVPGALSAFAQSISGMITQKQYSAVSRARTGAREFAQSSKLDQVDLTDLAVKMGTQEGRALAEAVDSCVIYNRTSSNMTNAYGLSIYFPYQKMSNVDKAVSAYNQIGMDEDYIRAIRQFASLEMSGQAVTGGSSHNAYAALSGQGSYSTGSYGSQDILGSLLGSLLGGDYSGFSGMGRAGFMSDRALDGDELVSYLSENLLNPDQLVFTDTVNGKALRLPSDQWALVQDIQLNMFYDDGSGYIDLGMDALYGSDENGNLVADTEGTWVAINGTPAPYYLLTVDGDTYTGYIPALLDGDRVQLLVSFDSEGQGYLVGARADYLNGETETVAKSISGLPVGSTIQLLCDRYSYDGTLDSTYYWGDPITVTEDLLRISDVYIDASRARRTYRLTDIYNQHYWTESY